jgi:arylformamidase
MNEGRIIDITPLISPRLGVFPGDTPFSRTIALDFAKGDHLALSSMTATLHIGAHADSPGHYRAGGEDIAARDLARYMGRCLVVRANAKPGERVGRRHLSWKGAWDVPRVLVATESFPDPDHWNSDFCSFEPTLIEEWAKAGVKLIGIDTPSIDPEDSKTLESHQMVAQHDLSILEGLVLTGVSEGYYTLVALPLKIEGADAAPVRAVLVEN